MSDGDTQKPGNDPRILLRVSEQFLTRRYFDDCRTYAHKAHQIDPNHPGVAQILAVADVLLASTHKLPTGFDWYRIMQLNRYSNDSNLIKQRFDHLYGLLNPRSNKFPFANEAFDIVCDAWYVLSCPEKKLEFDESVKKSDTNTNRDSDSDADADADADTDLSFWTACPYCYYLYEYPRVCFEQCVRCPNEKCCRAFTCIEIDEPPVEVLTVGKYVCSGFFPAGFQNGCWSPFLSKQKANATVDSDTDKFVNISDDDEGIESSRDEAFDSGENGGAGEVKMECGKAPEKANGGRKKAIARNCKKVTGVGNRVRKERFDDFGRTGDCVFF